MKKSAFSILLLIAALSFNFPKDSFGQTVYDVTPGTKGNRIIITLENESKVTRAENIEIKITKSPASLIFSNKQQSIKILDISKEKDVAFSFDIKRNIESHKKDTVEFLITGHGINQEKTFIINYTAPKEYSLSQNFPNPFNPSTTIRYDLPVDSRVSMKIYDILGNEVKTLIDEQQSAGYKEIKFNGINYASGVYICRLIANNPSGHNFVSIKKMMMVK